MKQQNIYVCITYPLFLARVAEENNVLDKIHSTTTWQPRKYSSYQNGSYYQEIPLMSNGKQRLSLILYNDDFVNLLFRHFYKNLNIFVNYWATIQLFEKYSPTR